MSIVGKMIITIGCLLFLVQSAIFEPKNPLKIELERNLKGGQNWILSRVEKIVLDEKN